MHCAVVLMAFSLDHSQHLIHWYHRARLDCQSGIYQTALHRQQYIQTNNFTENIFLAFSRPNVLQLAQIRLFHCKLFQVLHYCEKMGDFKASVVAYEVQKSFANKFFSNKTVAKSLIDDTSGNLLDNLYLLLYVFVSS